MPASSECTSCPYGSIQPDLGSASCFPCEAGKYRDEFAPDAQSCLFCNASTYMPLQGAANCFSCPNNSETGEPPQLDVNECRIVQKWWPIACVQVFSWRPEMPRVLMTLTILTSLIFSALLGLAGSQTIFDCKCKTGFFTPYGETGKECYACPLGAVCEGGRNMPYPKRGFWQLRHRAFRRVFVQCRPAELCLVGGYCREGHRGQYCGECRPDYYRRGRRCYPCDKGVKLSGDAMLLLVIGVIVSMCIGMYFLASAEAMKRSATIYVCIYFAQALDDFHDMSMTWPAEWEIVLSTMSIFNFDLQQVTCTHSAREARSKRLLSPKLGHKHFGPT